VLANSGVKLRPITVKKATTFPINNTNEAHNAVYTIIIRYNMYGTPATRTVITTKN